MFSVDVWYHILEQCELRDAIALTNTCWDFHELDNSYTWNVFIKKEFEEPYLSAEIPNGWVGNKAYRYLLGLRKFHNSEYIADNIFGAILMQRRGLTVIDTTATIFEISLPRLHLNHNEIWYIPSNFTPNVQVIYLQHNRITEIPTNWNPNYKHLSFYKIYLCHNNISEIPELWNPIVSYISIDYNIISHIPDRWLRDIRVSGISLAGNPIKSLGNWCPTESLTYLDIKGCPIPLREISEFRAKYPNISVAYNKF